LNDYGVCGFRFFASRLLGLEALEAPEAGMDNRQLGTLYHEILEATYRRLGGVIAPERTDEALAVLRSVADEKMATAPARLRFRPSFQWPQEQAVLRRRLEKLIRDDFGGTSPLDKKFEGAPREIYRQEARFGEDSPFSIDLDGEPLRLRGSIDRIDRQGDRVVLVDYKSGGTRFDKSEIERGRNFQMLIYLFAAQAVIDSDTAPDAPRSVAGGLFWQIGRDALGDLRADDSEVIAAGREHLSRDLGLARSGDFAAHANRLDAGKCAAYCDFHQMCRQSIMAKGKP
jgi:ATP-dependent helicase/DNAse subunit B